MIDKINRLLGISGTVSNRLRYSLCLLAQDYITISAETAIHIGYRERIAWLDAEVIAPAVKLTKAIEFENWPKLSDWLDPGFVMRRPGLHRSRTKPNRTLRDNLDRMVEWATELRRRLDERQQTGPKERTDYRYALVFDLTLIYAEHFPKRRPKRIYQPRGVHGEFPDFVRLAAEPILGRSEKLDHQIQVAIQKYNEMKNLPPLRRRDFHKI